MLHHKDLNTNFFNYLMYPCTGEISNSSGKCLKILHSDTECIDFLTDRAVEFSISPSYVSFRGRDVFAEILCTYYGGSGLSVNDARCLDIYDEALESMNENDLIRFCSANRHRWKRITD